jgi:hypothetical protein
METKARARARAMMRLIVRIRMGGRRRVIMED